MKIKITGTPNEVMKSGGYFNPYPYAGSLPSNPFGIANSMNHLNAENINSTVKAVDKEDANVEAEKGEILFKFDMGGLFDIKGKRHSQGGTPIVADENDFIFSRDKSLAITEDEKDLFDFKQKGKYKETENTPAKLLSKEVNPKHYNQLMAILDDPKSDEFAKKTAEIMLQKYQQKIGQVAYLQEAKKDFPKGIPQFAMGTAPVDAPEFNTAEAEETMYARKGGNVNTYSPQQVQRLQQRNAWDNNDYWNRGMQNAQNYLGYQGDNSAEQMQQFYSQQYPELINYAFNQGYWPNTNKGAKEYGDVSAQSLNPEQQLNAFTDNMRGVRFPMVQQQVFNTQEEMDQWIGDRNKITSNGKTFIDTRQGDLVNYTEPILRRRDQIDPISTGTPNINIDPPQGNPLKINPSLAGDVPEAGKQDTSKVGKKAQEDPSKAFTGMNIPWNAQEMLSTAAPFLSALAQPTYYDMLQQRHTPDIRLDRVNNQQEISNIQQQSSLAQREIGANMTGKNSQIANAGVRAQALNQMGQSYANINNANTQISNQEDMTNYQAGIQDQNFNLQNIRQTFVNNTLSQQRRNEQLTNAATDSLNKGLAIQSGLDALNQNISAQVMPYVDQYGNPPVILDPVTRVAVHNPAWKGDPLNNPFIGTQGGTDAASQLTQRLLTLAQQSQNPRDLAAALLAINKQTKNMPSILSMMNQR